MGGKQHSGIIVAIKQFLEIVRRAQFQKLINMVMVKWVWFFFVLENHCGSRTALGINLITKTALKKHSGSNTLSTFQKNGPAGITITPGR